MAALSDIKATYRGEIELSIDYILRLVIGPLDTIF